MGDLLVGIVDENEEIKTVELDFDIVEEKKEEIKPTSLDSAFRQVMQKNLRNAVYSSDLDMEDKKIYADVLTRNFEELMLKGDEKVYLSGNRLSLNSSKFFLKLASAYNPNVAEETDIADNSDLTGMFDFHEDIHLARVPPALIPFEEDCMSIGETEKKILSVYMDSIKDESLKSRVPDMELKEVLGIIKKYSSDIPKNAEGKIPIQVILNAYKEGVQKNFNTKYERYMGSTGIGIVIGQIPAVSNETEETGKNHFEVEKNVYSKLINEFMSKIEKYGEFTDEQKEFLKEYPDSIKIFSKKINEQRSKKWDRKPLEINIDAGENCISYVCGAEMAEFLRSETDMSDNISAVLDYASEDKVFKDYSLNANVEELNRIIIITQFDTMEEKNFLAACLYADESLCDFESVFSLKNAVKAAKELNFKKPFETIKKFYEKEKELMGNYILEELEFLTNDKEIHLKTDEASRENLKIAVEVYNKAKETGAEIISECSSAFYVVDKNADDAEKITMANSSKSSSREKISRDEFKGGCEEYRQRREKTYNASIGGRFCPPDDRFGGGKLITHFDVAILKRTNLVDEHGTFIDESKLEAGRLKLNLRRVEKLAKGIFVDFYDKDKIYGQERVLNDISLNLSSTSSLSDITLAENMYSKIIDEKRKKEQYGNHYRKEHISESEFYYGVNLSEMDSGIKKMFTDKLSEISPVFKARYGGDSNVKRKKVKRN